MSEPTVQQIAMRMLRYIGVTSLLPQPAGSELESLAPGDLDDVAMAITGAMQEIAAVGPLEAREVPGFAVLHAPTSITLSVAGQSNAISSVSGWQSWMQGCTVRVAGDDQDNELLSNTTLARAYMGSTGAGITATVYGDTITLDDTIGKIAAPLWLPNELPLWPAKDRFEFLRLGGYPLVTDVNGMATGLPFYLYYRKPVARPWTWFIDAAYDGSLGYTQRRIRFSPMPDQAYSVAYTAGMNPPRVTAANIVSPLQTLTAGGAIAAPNINQTYNFIADIGGYGAFGGQADPSYVIYYNPAQGYILGSEILLNTVPSPYFRAPTPSSPLGTYLPTGSTDVITVTTSDTGSGQADPGTVLPIPNGWAESILLPMALKRFSGTPTFKNDRAAREIDRQYKSAVAALKDSRGLEATSRAKYV
jgi:hypothetical protein